MGPALGGGHGRLQGLHGLVADNMLHLNVVLADGSTIAVNETSHKDLFWAMKGAGHNFGIVTSVDVKIYPSLNPTWHWHNYLWAEDKLERVFKELNKLQDNGDGPVLLGSSFGSIALNKSISETEVHEFPILFVFSLAQLPGSNVNSPFSFGNSPTMVLLAMQRKFYIHSTRSRLSGTVRVTSPIRKLLFLRLLP